MPCNWLSRQSVGLTHVGLKIGGLLAALITDPGECLANFNEVFA